MRQLLNKVRNFLNFGIRYRWVEYGNNVHVQWNTRIFCPHRIFRMGDHVGIGAHCTINTDVIMGNHVMLASHVGLVSRDAHTADMPETTMFESPRGDRHRVIIEDDVWIGFGAIVLSGVTIGRGSIVAAGALVTKDVPPYSVVAARPAAVVKMRFDDDEIRAHEAALLKRGIITAVSTHSGPR